MNDDSRGVKPPHAWRRWLQFRLRTLLLLMLVVAPAVNIWQARNRKLAARGPIDWDVGQLSRQGTILRPGRNIRWQRPLGSACFASPVISGGKLFVGTNNSFRTPYLT